jgi:hypothetical protein
MHFSDEETKDAIKAYIREELRSKLDQAIAKNERGE